MNKQRNLALLFIFTLITLIFNAPQPVQAQAGTPAEVLSQINGLRAGNGLSPLAENQYLNIAAQNHANWIAAGNPGGHIGAGGSSATDRAVAVGYGGGAGVRVTENWARGPGLTAYGVVYDMWATSSIHMSQMLTTNYYEFGAGVALDGSGMTVYVVKFGRVDGSAPPANNPGESSYTPPPPINLVTVAEANPDDGSVIHVVKYGQSLWTIWDAYDEAYGLTMDELLAQNGLTEESIIRPEQELLIIPAIVEVDDVEAEEAVETAPTQSPIEEPTPTPSPTPTKAVEIPAAPEYTPTPTEAPNTRQNMVVNIFSGDTRLVGFGLVAVSVFGIALLFFTSSRLK